MLLEAAAAVEERLARLTTVVEVVVAMPAVQVAPMTVVVVPLGLIEVLQAHGLEWHGTEDGCENGIFNY